MATAIAAVVVLSALSGDGVDDLLACAAAHLRKDARLQEVTLGAGDGEAMAWLHQHGEVLHQESEGLETRLLVRIAPAEWAGLRACGRSSRASRCGVAWRPLVLIRADKV